MAVTAPRGESRWQPTPQTQFRVMADASWGLGAFVAIFLFGLLRLTGFQPETYGGWAYYTYYTLSAFIGFGALAVVTGALMRAWHFVWTHNPMNALSRLLTAKAVYLATAVILGALVASVNGLVAVGLIGAALLAMLAFEYEYSLKNGAR